MRCHSATQSMGRAAENEDEQLSLAMLGQLGNHHPISGIFCKLVCIVWIPGVMGQRRIPIKKRFCSPNWSAISVLENLWPEQMRLALVPCVWHSTCHAGRVNQYQIGNNGAPKPTSTPPNWNYGLRDYTLKPTDRKNNIIEKKHPAKRRKKENDEKQ